MKVLIQFMIVDFKDGYSKDEGADWIRNSKLAKIKILDILFNALDKKVE